MSQLVKNLSTAIFLVNDKVRGIHCTYEPDQPGNPAKRTLFKTFDTAIKVDDLVVVPTNTRHKATVVKVTAVDVEPDFNSSEEVDWVMGIVDSALYHKLKSQEGQMAATIKSAEKKKQRDELKAAVFADTEEQIARLPIATMGAERRIEPPAPPARPGAEPAAGQPEVKF